jgi:hypothetical protein
MISKGWRNIAISLKIPPTRIPVYVQYVGSRQGCSQVEFKLLHINRVPVYAVESAFGCILRLWNASGPTRVDWQSRPERYLQQVSIALFLAATGVLDTLHRHPRFHSRSWIRQRSPQANASRLSLLRLVSSPEYRLCGRSLRTAMPRAFFCPIRTRSRLPRVIPV